MKRFFSFIIILSMIIVPIGCSRKISMKEYVNRFDRIFNTFEQTMTYYLDANLSNMFYKNPSGKFSQESYRGYILGFLKTLDEFTDELDTIGWIAPNNELQNLQWNVEKYVIQLKDDLFQFTQQERFKDDWVLNVYMSGLELDYDFFLIVKESLIQIYKALTPLNMYLDSYRSTQSRLMSDSTRSEQRLHVLDSLVIHFQTISLLIAESPSFTRLKVIKKDTYSLVEQSDIDNKNTIDNTSTLIRLKYNGYGANLFSFYELNIGVLHTIYEFNHELISSFYFPTSYLKHKEHLLSDIQLVNNYIDTRAKYSVTFFELDESYKKYMDRNLITSEYTREFAIVPPKNDPLYLSYWKLMFSLKRTHQLFVILDKNNYLNHQGDKNKIPSIALNQLPYDEELSSVTIK